MRNHILALTAIAMTLTLSGCNEGDNKQSSTTPPAQVTQQPAASTAQTTTTTITQTPATTKPAATITTKPTSQTTTTTTTTTTTQTPVAPVATKPVEPAPATNTTTTTTTSTKPVAATSGNAANGGVIFKASCAGCHGSTGDGNGPAASSLKPKPANFIAADYKDSTGKNPREYSDADLLAIIQNGRKGTSMPAWKKQLKIEQQNDVLAYIRSLAK